MSSEGTPKNDINALAYDAQVFSKGLLLNAELEIQKLIEQSGDTVFANRYYKIQQDRAILDDLYQIAPEKREMDVDSLAKVIDREERLLVESSKELGDYTKNLSISWRDVQKNLKDNDLAIEFATVDDTIAKQTMYVALVLKKGMSAPEIVTLFNTDDFYDINTKEYYTTSKLYNLVWQPLAEYLKDAKTVYFSPAGRIHTIGIEYLSGDDGKIFAEKFDTYRLSSTRELAITHTINPNRKATTYGGIQYEFSPDEWRSLRDVNDSIERSFRDIPQIADNMRGGASGMSYLDGTKLESAAIANLLRSVNYDVNTLSDASATEESFKMLSGSGIQILHIGTHGFYESEGDMENAGYKFYTAASQQTDEDKALSCSGLFFAGANSALNPKHVNEIPEGADDGILTAKEISRLDFSGLDLVVLSACQTGLGEVTGEGVFGLQRGFKKAGAQTIVMSLWKVADEPTQLLMVEFFKNLT
ncbi:MAG: CHAT domain-containing protein, partial [Bacteroidales bacterium]|nr:CHAT domain-containing protein [Bacteroidales bacterium]